MDSAHSAHLFFFRCFGKGALFFRILLFFYSSRLSLLRLSERGPEACTPRTLSAPGPLPDVLLEEEVVELRFPAAVQYHEELLLSEAHFVSTGAVPSDGGTDD